MTKKKIELNYGNTYIDKDGFGPNDISLAINAFVEKEPLVEFDSMTFFVEEEYGYYDERWFEIKLKGHRFESDEEYENRLAKEEEKKQRDKENAAKSRKKAKEDKEKKDLAEYIRLKEKYEG